MNKELLEKLEAIRRYLLALKAQAADIKKLAEIAGQISFEEMDRVCSELRPYMTGDQKSRSVWYFIFGIQAGIYSESGEEFLIQSVTHLAPRLLADLDDIAKKLEQE